MEGRADELATATQRRLRAVRQAARPDARMRVEQPLQADHHAGAVVRDLSQVPQALPGQPLAHVCAPRSDFRRRKTAHEKQQRDRARKKRHQEARDYTACADNDCKRTLCVAYKTGWKAGDEAGYERGWQQGYDRGFPDGIAACPARPRVRRFS